MLLLSNELVSDLVSCGSSTAGSKWNPHDIRDLIRLHSGKVGNLELYRKMVERRNMIERQADYMSGLLSASGIITERPSEIVAIGAVTGIVRPVRQWKNINLLLPVQQANRRKLLLDLECYINSDPRERIARYLVLTYGPRVAISELRDGIAAFNRKISKYAYEVRTRFNVEVICRSNEFPISSDKTCHLHANLLYFAPHLGTKRWQEFLAFTRTFFSSHVRESGKVQDLREIVRYIFKGEDLHDLTVKEAADLYHATFRRRMFAAYGPFSEFRRDLRKGAVKLVRVGGKVQHQWKRQFNHRLSESKVGIDGGACSTCGEDIKKIDDNAAHRTGGDAKNVLLSTIAPTAFLSHIYEPVMIVYRYDPSASTGRSMDRLVDIYDIVDAATQAAAANGFVMPAGGISELVSRAQDPEAGYKVHIDTISVCADQKTQSENDEAENISVVEGRYLAIFDGETKPKSQCEVEIRKKSGMLGKAGRKLLEESYWRSRREGFAINLSPASFEVCNGKPECLQFLRLRD